MKEKTKYFFLLLVLSSFWFEGENHCKKNKRFALIFSEQRDGNLRMYFGSEPPSEKKVIKRTSQISRSVSQGGIQKTKTGKIASKTGGGEYEFLIRMNIRIYFFPKNGTNEYPNIFISKK